ncbi:hypothetical protein LWI28_001014 [Acer negundo]|uniref:Uncharacterized protein n=1 Tax=Acer negundo TaxID=4023 RepID=A0AAD5ND08_ACENE|nr:hypothetical protein LWI28_001014 [Acer negundo]
MRKLRKSEAKDLELEAEDSESEAEGSEPEAEDIEGAEEDDNVRLLTQMLKVLKATRRQKKAYPFAPSYTRPTSGPTILEEAAQIHIATERSLKELEDRKAAVRDPSGKGKGKLPGAS